MLCVESVQARANAAVASLLLYYCFTTALLLLYNCFTTALLLRVCVCVCVPGVCVPVQRAGARVCGAVDGGS